eukprot:2280577-Prymnesium_polylepis.1
MTNRRDTNAHMRANGVLRSHSTISGRHSREQSSRGEECQRNVDARPSRAAGRSSSSTDVMSEASARRRRAAFQWICVAGVRRATEARQPS